MKHLYCEFQEPCEGSFAIILPEDTNMEVLEGTIAWFKQRAGGEWGGTIISAEIRDGEPKDIDLVEVDDHNDLMEQLSNEFRYVTREGLWDEDCPQFAELGIQRT